MPRGMRSRSSRIGRKAWTTSTWFTMSRSLLPCHSRRSTWVSGSRRPPNLEVVLRMPLATALTLPWRSVRKTMILSASPRR